VAIWRRIRGILGIAATWFVTWASLGAIYLAIDVFRISLRFPAILDHLFAGLATAGLLWGKWGAASGILYGISVTITQRGRDFAQLRVRNLALWGALSGAAYPGLLWVTSILTPAGIALPDTPLAIALGAVAGAASAGGTLWLARRANPVALGAKGGRSLEPGLEDVVPAKRAYDAFHQ